MTEHQFATAAPSRSLDYGEMLDALRCHSSEWLENARVEALREQRWWHLRELAITCVLDERGRVDDAQAAEDGITTRDARRKRATAKKLASRPRLATAAAQGELSDEQLDRLTDLVDDDDPEADEHWATEGPKWSPQSLADEVRKQRTPTVEDARARRAARELRFWWRHDGGMLDGRFSLPDIDGAMFESVINDLVERMRPGRGEGWETRERRGADALMDLVRAHADTRDDSRPGAPRAHLIVQVPLYGPATVAGVPLPDAMVERLRAGARIEPVLVDGEGEPVAVGRTEAALGEKTRRVVKQRDGKCRWPGCDRRVGLEIHHLWPRSWGGTDEIANLATVCVIHHARLAPQGPMLLLGNPNNPAGLSLLHRDDLPALAHLAAETARAGPEAA